MKQKLHKILKIDDLKDMLDKSGKIYGDKPAYKLKTKTPGEYKIITHKEARENINNLGTALIEMGLKGKRIAVISHGGSIKFFLLNWCEVNEEVKLVYNNTILNITSPCLLKMIFRKNKLVSLEQIK